MARFRATLLASAILAAAPVVGAQQPVAQPVAVPAADSTRPATHLVKRGDTLWDLARLYLGDAYLWPEIYRLNTEVVEDPHWIYPGETLRLPGVVVASGDPAVALVPAAPHDTNATTIFDPRRYRRPRGTRQSIMLQAPHQAVRPGEYIVAPFAWAVGGPAGAGRVRSTAASQIVVPNLEQRVFQSQEPIFVTLPAGGNRVNGELFLTYSLGPMIPGRGQLVVPTALIRLADDAGVGDARAVIVDRYREVLAGQGVMPVDSLTPRPDVFPEYVEFGATTSVAWLVDEPVITQKGSYLVLSSSSTDGLVPGDQVTLFAPLGTGAAGEMRAPEEAAVLQVLRVTPYGVSAIIMRRSPADITVGMAGRITAKMP